MEEGEFDMDGMEEGELEMEEIECSQEEAVEDEDDDEPPKLVPIEEEKKTKPKKKVVEKEESVISVESSDVTESEWGSISSNLDTEELEELEAEHGLDQSNTHGFVYAADLDTYRMSKKERIEAKERE